jgi:Tol biopolymer transport system component
MRVLLLSLLLLLVTGSAAGSPTSSGRIAFWSERDGDPDVFTMNEDGSDVQNIGRRGWGDKRASWSPDGRRIVFDSWLFGEREFDLWLMNADGSDKSRLTTSPLRDVLPAWSPDGRWIVFTRKRASSPAEDLWLIRPDGTGEHRLTPLASGAAWSPDSRRIVYSHRSDLWVIDLNGRNRRRLTRASGYDGPSAGGWSPDGRRILFTRWPPARLGDVYELNVRVGSVRRLTSSSGDDIDASWSPDGRRILFSSARKGNREVYLMNAAGSGKRNISRSPAADWANTWQPVR